MVPKLLVHASATPLYYQDKNGLAECRWQSMIYTVRNWLALAELPKPFGFTLSIALQRCATIFHLSVLLLH
jgi:hypothetical protein